MGVETPDELAALRAEVARITEELARLKKSGEPPPPTEAEALREELAELQTRTKSGEIRGMSESTGHALFETMKKLMARLDTLALAPPPPTEPPKKPKGWWPWED